MGGLKIHVSHHGEELEQAVVLLHSSGQSSAQWRGYLSSLAKAGWHTIAVDLIGNGKSPPWQEPERFQLRFDVEQVVALLQSLSGKTHAVVGHSYGGFVGLQALRDPSVSATGAVLFEPGAWGVLASDGSDNERARLKATSGDWFADDANGDSEDWMRTFVEYWGGHGAWDFIGPRGRDAMMSTARQTFAQARSLAFDDTPLAAYESLSVPVHLITGSTSPREVRAICRLLADLRPENSITEVAGGHMAPVLDPATVAPVICSQLALLTNTAKLGRAAKPS